MWRRSRLATWFVVLLVIGSGSGVSAKPRGAGKSSGLMSRTPASVSVLGKLRMAMLQWYCVETTTHSAERPCQNYMFMQKMRKADSAEARKALVAERSRSMPSDDEGRKALALQSRKSYVTMYKMYCDQPTPGNPEVCSNEALKKMYESFEKTSSKGAVPL